MARDFRPKDRSSKKARKSQGLTGNSNSSFSSSKPTSSSTSSTSAKPSSFKKQQQQQTSNSDEDGDDGYGDDEDDDDDAAALMENIKAMGGSKDDLKLISGLGKSGKDSGKGKMEFGDQDESLSSDVKSFLSKLNFSSKSSEDTSSKTEIPEKSKKKGKEGEKATTSENLEDSKKKEKTSSEPTTTPTKETGKEKKLREKKLKDQEKKEKAKKDREEASRKAPTEEVNSNLGWKEARDLKSKQVKEGKPVESVKESAYGPNSASAKKAKTEKGSLLIQPQPRWYEAIRELENLPLPPSTKNSKSKKSKGQEEVEGLSDERISHLHSLGQGFLESENQIYSTLSSSDSTGSIGTLSTSDAKFIRSLLSDGGGVGGGGGTVADRSSALTLLLQSSPLHNVKALDALLGMSGKKNREEKSRAIRSLTDWWISNGGIGGKKLRYFADQDMAVLKSIDYVLENQAKFGADTVKNAKVRLCVASFEGQLKTKYFSFLQILEGMSHDTLVFLRKSSLVSILSLLKDSPEQESNLLRLLVNKLGDNDRGVAARSSTLLLDLLTTHPGMKAVVVREVANLILKPSQAQFHSSEDKEKDGESKENASNHHAKYYGLLTLNQTLLTNQENDKLVATRLIELYFSIFDDLLRNDETGIFSTDKQDLKKQSEEGLAEGEEGASKDKKRWRNDKGGKGKKGKGPKNKQPQGKAPNVLTANSETSSKMIAAILTGVRRAWPFAEIEKGYFDKNIETLFKITHDGNFNISIQSLALIFMVCLGDGQKKDGEDVNSSTTIKDRYYRTLYSSLLDPRLATTSKSSMYLNLLFKSLKKDDDLNRKKSFIKRLCQVLNIMEPDFICGGLILLGQLFKFDGSLRMMLNSAEDDEEDGVEVFKDVEIESDEEGNVTQKSLPDQSQNQILDSNLSRYDAKKRDPRFSNAEKTCLWDLLPLLTHFHPSVSLQANQLLNSQLLTSTSDLTLNTLSHFLDRFVYRNPKKQTAKGSSAMQPDGNEGGDPDTMVVRIKGKGIGKEEFANDEKFWRRKVGDVPVDQLFFHRYFNQKLQRQQDAADKKEKIITRRRKGVEGEGSEEGESEEDAVASDEEGDISLDSGSEMDMDGIESPDEGLDEEGPADDENVPNGAESDIDQELDSDEDEEEKEIWKAMKNSMPHEKGDEDLMMMSGGEDDEDEDDEDLGIYDYEDSDDENLLEWKGDAEGDEEDGPEILGDLEDFRSQDETNQNQDDDDTDGGEDVFEAEDEDDLLPFTSFDGGDEDDEASNVKKGKKRGLDEDEEKEDDSKSKNKERNKERREQKKRRKELPIFASADDYAHLLGGSDDEDVDDA